MCIRDSTTVAEVRGRGAMIAIELVDDNNQPNADLTAKGVGGGMPLSAVTGRAEIMDAPDPGSLGGTYAGNPVACAASLAAFEEMEELDLASRAREIEAIIREELEPLLELTTVAEVRGRGAMIAIELVDDNNPVSYTHLTLPTILRV